MTDTAVEDVSFRKEIETAINRHSRENGSDTPDFILASYLARCLDAFDATIAEREAWYGRQPKLAIGNSVEIIPPDRT